MSYFIDKISEDQFVIYPLVLVNDRYSGTYSGAQWTAWEEEPNTIPDAIFGDDDSCFDFWLNANKDGIGFGDTPDEAIKDLRYKLIKKILKENTTNEASK